MTGIAILSTAHIHTQSFIDAITKAEDGRKIIGIWDDDSARGRRYADGAGAPFYDAIEALLEHPEVDGFIICSENTRHLPLLERVLPIGKPVFCEKPLVTNVESLQRVRALLATHPTPLMCGYFFPFSGEMLAVKQRLESGELGKLTHASMVTAHHGAYRRWFDSPGLEWFAQPEFSGGGALMDLGTHAVHLLTTLFGPVDEVWAQIANYSGVYPAVDDYGVILMRFANGILGRAEAAWTQTGGVKGLSVFGDRAAIWPTAEGYRIGEPERESIVLDRVTPERPKHVDRLVALIRGELSESELKLDLTATCRAVAIIEAAYHSSETGGWVRVSQP